MKSYFAYNLLYVSIKKTGFVKEALLIVKKINKIFALFLCLIAFTIPTFAAEKTIVDMNMQRDTPYIGYFKDTLEAPNIHMFCPPLTGRVRVKIVHNSTISVANPGDRMSALSFSIYENGQQFVTGDTADQYVTFFDLDVVANESYTVALWAGRAADMNAVYTVEWNYI